MLCRACSASEKFQYLVARPLERSAQWLEYLTGYALLFAEQAEQQVLSANVTVSKRLSDRKGLVEGTHCGGCVGQRLRLDCLVRAFGYRVVNVFANPLQVEIEIHECGGRDAFTLPDDPKENVLRIDVFVPETHSFFSRQDKHLSRSIREVVS
jgi:hypothetical protein